MSQNGRFADADLAEIPGGRLEKEAAANWLALRRLGGRELQIWISPLGPRSSYRTFAEQQYFWDLYQSGRGNLAAKPGTSNHGLGRAIDLADPRTMRRVVDRYGKPFGWQWGEAPSESWHVTYRGHGKAGLEELRDDDHRTLRPGHRGDDVRMVQRWFVERGFRLSTDGVYGDDTQDAVRRLYRAWGHEPHGNFGDAGWSVLDERHPWRVLTGNERDHLAELFAQRRIARRNGGWDQIDGSHLEAAKRHKEWLTERRKLLWREAKRTNWRVNNRRRRYLIIRSATT